MISFFQPSSPYVFPDFIDLTQPTLYLSVATILFNPTFWNIVAQNEYHNKTITKILNGNRYLGCYLLAGTIFSLGILRDHVYNEALKNQPQHPALLTPAIKYLAVGLIAAGNVFVLSSMWALGVTGTYLGDYFGILMDHMVEGFPFNVMGDPMYWGSSMSFAGVALWYGKPAGLALTLVVILAYTVALRFEGPFTSQIYAAAAKKSDNAAAKKNIDAPAARTRAHTGTPSKGSGTDSPSGTPSKRSRRSASKK